MSRARSQSQPLPLHQADFFQQEAISSSSNAIRIVAPAGSGKTEAVVRRVIERTTEEGIDPRRILMLTFDNNGQQAFTRMLKAFAPRQVLPRFQTFNRFGKQILDEHFPEDDVRIVTDYELRPFMRRIAPMTAILSWDGRERPVRSAFRAMKEQGLRPLEVDRKDAIAWLQANYLELPLERRAVNLFDVQAHRLGHDPARESMQQLNALFDAYLLYERELRARNRMDLEDQKLRAFLRLVRNKRIVERERQRYDEIIIDEAQDISRLDALLIWHVIGEHTTITLAGDDDQTIYEFKQASSVFLRDAPRYFDRDFETFLLQINYRSPDAILQPAQQLIAHNVERIEKTAISARVEPGEVIVHRARSHQERIEGVVQTIRRFCLPLNDPEAYAFDEVGILAPSSYDLDAFEEALQREGIPTKRNTGQNDTGEIVDAVELSTIHRAKGRQWRLVILPMSGDGEMPRPDAIFRGDLEAERRAYYVSMSRAADVLHVAYVREGSRDTIRRSASGEVIGTSGASRFLFEAGLVTEDVVAEVPRAEEALVGEEVIAAEIATTVVPPEDALLTPLPLAQHVFALAAKAERKRAEADYRYALFDGWQAVFAALKALDGGRSGRNGDAHEIIELLRKQKRIPGVWVNRLHQWRQTRNKGYKQDTYEPAGIDDLVDGVHAFLELAMSLIEEVPPAPIVIPPDPEPTAEPVVPEPPDDPVQEVVPGETIVAPRRRARKLYPVETAKVMQILAFLQRGGIDPGTKRPIRQIAIHAHNDTIEFLPFQLGMILFDIRYFMPDAYRFSAMPMFGSYCLAAYGDGLPAEIVASAQLPIPEAQQAHVGTIHTLMDETLVAYQQLIGERNPAELLRRRLEDALTIGNGATTRGIILTPGS